MRTITDEPKRAEPALAKHLRTRCSLDCRPVYGGMSKFQKDPHWRDNLLFYEYFHGDNGAGLGASHQTGWTGVVAKLIQIFGVLDSKRILEGSIKGAFVAQARLKAGEDVDRHGLACEFPMHTYYRHCFLFSEVE